MLLGAIDTTGNTGTTLEAGVHALIGEMGMSRDEVLVLLVLGMVLLPLAAALGLLAGLLGI